MLAAASGEKQAESGAASMGHHAAKRVQADWKLVLGEVALDIRPGKITQGLAGKEQNLVEKMEVEGKSR